MTTEKEKENKTLFKDMKEKKTLIKIAVATNPLTWIYFALVFMYGPIDYLLKKSGIHDIWFIYFRIPKLGNVRVGYVGVQCRAPNELEKKRMV